MLLLVLLFEIVVPLAALTNMEARCGEDVYLPCGADFKRIQYFSLTWYYMTQKERNGIIRKNLMGDKSVRLYDFNRTVSIDEQNRLLFSKVTPADSGKYECDVSANVGEKNVNMFVELTVPECEPEQTTVSVTTENTSEQLEDCMDCSDTTSAPHVPLIWSLLGYGMVAVTKILLSVITVWGFHVWTKRKRRW